jgi:hypothetical protein
MRNRSRNRICADSGTVNHHQPKWGRRIKEKKESIAIIGQTPYGEACTVLII